ncbi:MAG: helix-turn-helix transcriptional regulator [Clostridia bacterium]|nr:helix-turn-helix transcriptional regulator [Clostridia bacterium]
MEMNIGTNIKRLRLSKGMTQEQLAGLLSVSTAAVSKWEAQNTYPDITLLFPLAQLFGVSVDELLGYDEAKEKADIDAVISEYLALGRKRDFAARDKLIRQARKTYPHDFRIMNTYMWHLAGGSADNDPSELMKHKDELSGICDRILENCTADKLRASAITVKAKLLHAEGKTEEAIKLIDTLPEWYSPQMKEQLFAKDTAEYRYWNRRNAIGLIDVSAIKFARIVRYDPTLSFDEKIEKLCRIAQAFSELQQKTGMALYCIAEHSVLTVAAGMFFFDCTDVGSSLRVNEMLLVSAQKMIRAAQNDEALTELIRKTYQTDSLVAWHIDQIEKSSAPQYIALRGHPETFKMLEKFK